MDWLHETSRRRPDAPAVIRDGSTITYGELHDLATRVAGPVRGAGPVLGERVAYWGEQNLRAVAAAWGIPRAIMEQYREVIEGVGCQVVGWDCDPWAMTRFVRICAAGADEATIAAVHVEAESLEIALIRGEHSVGTTSLRRDVANGSDKQWDSDEPDAVATEIHRSLEVLSRRWLPIDPDTGDQVERVWFTGSVENPDSLLAALVRTLKTRVEMIDITARIGIDEALASSPLIESNLGSFALCIGGALADVRP